MSERNQMVGAYIPISLVEKVSLIALAEDLSKANLIRRLLEEYVAKQDLDQLIEHIANRLFILGEEVLQKRNLRSIFERYILEVRLSLKRRAVSAEHIAAIIPKVVEEYEKKYAKKIGGTFKRAAKK